MMPASAALRPSLIVEPMPEPAQPRRPSFALAASDPPRGRILLVEAHAIVALDLQRVLREAGWRSIGPAVSTGEIRALMLRCRPDGAVVDLEGLGEAAAEIADLLAVSGVPFVFLTTGRDPIPARHMDRPVVDKPCLASELLDTLEQAIAKQEQGIALEDMAYSVPSAPALWPPQL